MTDIKVSFDEQVLAKAVVDQVVQAIQDEFHKLFPRLRREDMDNIHLTGTSIDEQTHCPCCGK